MGGTDVVRAMSVAFGGCIDQGALQLLFQRCFLTGGSGAEELLQNCMGLLGDKSEWTTSARLLACSPNEFLKHVLHQSASSADALGLPLRKFDEARDNKLGPALWKLFCNGINASKSHYILFNGAYVPVLSDRALGQTVVERVLGDQPLQISSFYLQPSKVSRFKQQRLLRDTCEPKT